MHRSHTMNRHFIINSLKPQLLPIPHDNQPEIHCSTMSYICSETAEQSPPKILSPENNFQREHTKGQLDMIPIQRFTVAIYSELPLIWTPEMRPLIRTLWLVPRVAGLGGIHYNRLELERVYSGTSDKGLTSFCVLFDFWIKDTSV